MFWQRPEESVWTERSDLRITWPENGGDAYTNAYIALDVLGEYVENNTMFETVDHVALFSGSVRSGLVQQFISYSCLIYAQALLEYVMFIMWWRSVIEIIIIINVDV